MSIESFTQHDCIDKSILLLLFFTNMNDGLLNMIIMTCYYCSWCCSYYKNYGSSFNMSLLTYYCCYCSQPHELYDMIIISHSFMDCDHGDILLLLLLLVLLLLQLLLQERMKTCRIWIWHTTTAATALTLDNMAYYYCCYCSYHSTGWHFINYGHDGWKINAMFIMT